MRIENISIKTLTVCVLLIIGILSITLSLVAGFYFREAALASQAQSLSRVIEVASGDILSELRDRSISFGNTLQSREAFRSAIAKFHESGQAEPLTEQLDDPFIKGFEGTGTIDLAKLRVYDPNLKLLRTSQEGIAGLEPQLPRFLFTKAESRKGVERLKALSGLWVSPSGPLYSVLVPIGGLRLTGYLEVVVNPAFNLGHVSTLTEMPIKIYGMNDKLLHQSEQTNRENKAGEEVKLPVEYLMPAENNQPAYRLVGLEDVTRFSNDMYKTQVATTIAFLVLTVSTLSLALWAFSRFLFRPIKHMMDDIHRYTVEGSLTTTTAQDNTKEFHALSDAFTDMMKKIQSSIHELERISSLDGLTGVANRRSLDTALNKEWLRAQRSKTEVSLLMIDIDFFKLYNDHFGHQAGDDCLKIVAVKIAQLVTRPGDLLARYGGEEFAVLLPGTSSEGATSVATHILDAVAALNIHHPKSTISNIVTLSIGICTLLPSDELSPHHLIGFADEALYQAKAAGRNQIRATSPEDLAKARLSRRGEDT
ncbi:MAG: GGDEF domain-containing protein [Gammaproteobacteria bacterium]|nr:GGDEF domain-containing protein [Gammaproteobacteria bacterium]MBU1979265.1 GGDEF domain-containing protein [Gammaproteobacteria bacterium]